jgi:DNA-binding protein HU-beta/integration host factor subunit beta
VTKKDLARALATELNLPAVVALQAVQMTLDGITRALVDERRIELRNFGVFAVRKRRARQARNPRTGERVKVPAKLVVTFKPGRDMEEQVGKSKKPPAGE